MLPVDVSNGAVVHDAKVHVRWVAGWPHRTSKRSEIEKKRPSFGEDLQVANALWPDEDT